MYEPVLVIGNCGHRRLASPVVPFHSVVGKACLADAMQLTLEGLGHICCIAEGQLVASEQQRMHHCQ